MCVCVCVCACVRACCAGILLVVALGVALGVFVGGTLLTIVAFCMKKFVYSLVFLLSLIGGCRLQPPRP